MFDDIDWTATIATMISAAIIGWVIIGAILFIEYHSDVEFSTLALMWIIFDRLYINSMESAGRKSK